MGFCLAPSLVLERFEAPKERVPCLRDVEDFFEGGIVRVRGRVVNSSSEIGVHYIMSSNDGFGSGMQCGMKNIDTM